MNTSTAHMNEWEARCQAWDRDYRRYYRAVLLSTADRCQALDAAIEYADHQDRIRHPAIPLPHLRQET